MTDPQVAIFMLSLFIFLVLLGFPIAFTLIAMGVGFGYYAVVGLEAMFEEGGNLELNLRASRDNIRLGNGDGAYQEKLWNFSLYVTWLIPPHIGDFVRASF